MELKKSVPNNTITRDLAKLSKTTGNVYQSIVIISKRANQISTALKHELTGKLEEFSKSTDTLEETFENREQIEISRYYEKLPKSTLIAISEFEENNIHSRRID